MTGIGLDIGGEVPSTDFGETCCYAGGDGGDGRYAGCEAVAAAVGEVVRWR